MGIFSVSLYFFLPPHAGFILQNPLFYKSTIIIQFSSHFAFGIGPESSGRVTVRPSWSENQNFEIQIDRSDLLTVVLWEFDSDAIQLQKTQLFERLLQLTLGF